MSKSKAQRESILITLVVLHRTRFHYKACFEDSSGRPEYNCVCPLKDTIDKLQKEWREYFKGNNE
ncbi:hypothetical protein LCGC14_1027190 [marine sediment metagenome]|uniref:Uncharacterized protein n=1 Tax=marine sediment metagenome TaxID=412755 RepID=A0A0F9N0B8_9ZZZZ